MYKDAQYKMAAQQEWSGVDGVSTSTFPWKKKLHGLVLKMQGREPIHLVMKHLHRLVRESFHVDVVRKP